MANKKIYWIEEKNQLLQLQRGISFNDVLTIIENKKVIDRKIHPNQDKYPGQQIFIIFFNDYIYYVPFVENEKEIFVKSIISSRKFNQFYKDLKNEKLSDE